MSVDEWLSFSKSCSHFKAREKAKEIDANITWDWNLPRTTEGFYQIRGGMEYAISKSLAVAPFADIIWMETKTANLKDADIFAKAIHEKFPDQMLAYNLSPSFNWDTTGMTDEEMRHFPSDIGKLGYVFNFITYGGHQADGVAGEELATALKQDGMLALARLQRKLRLLESPYKTPQSLVGGPRLDGALAASSGRTATTKAMGKGSTQFQHLIQTEPPLTILEGWLAKWAECHVPSVKLKARLKPLQPGSDILELLVEDSSNNNVANVVFKVMRDREDKVFLFIRNQILHDETLRRKRFMTLVQLFLIHRFKADIVEFMAPNEDNRQQVKGMCGLKIFKDYIEEIGDIIVAHINKNTIQDLTGTESNAITTLLTSK